MRWFPPSKNILTYKKRVEQDLSEQLRLECFIYRRSFLCKAHRRELIRIQRGVKDPEPGIIFISSVEDYMACCSLTAAVMSSRYVRFTETDIMCFFSPASGNKSHRSRQCSALCDMFISMFSLHVCSSYSKPRVSIHGLEITTLGRINLCLSFH